MTYATTFQGPALRAARGLLAAISLAALTACGGGGDTATPGTGIASECLNVAQLTTAGNTQRTTHTLRSGADTATEVVDRVVLGPATFNGQSVTNTRYTTTTAASGTTDVLITLAHDAISAAAIVSHGVTTESSPGVGVTLVTNTPGEAFRFDLKAGETANQTVVTVVDGDAANANTRSLSWTFVGQEDVTVPAGTFRQACRFSSRETETAGAVVSNATFWLARGSGVLVKMEGTDTLQGQTSTGSRELVSATQNGVAVTP